MPSEIALACDFGYRFQISVPVYNALILGDHYGRRPRRSLRSLRIGPDLSAPLRHHGVELASDFILEGSKGPFGREVSDDALPLLG